MLKSIEMKGYRCFEQYKLGGLSRVNLLVGKNNCGKTALLEAIWLAVSEGEPSVLFQIAERRGEVESLGNGPNAAAMLKSYKPSYNHFFNGHEIDLGMSFSVCSEQQSGLTNLVSFTVDDAVDPGLRSELQSYAIADTSPGKLYLLISNSNDASARTAIPLGLGDTRVFYIPSHRQRELANKKTPVAQFTAPEFVRTIALRLKWDKVLSDGRKSDVIKAMQILSPDITDIDFLSSDIGYSASGSVLMAFNSGERVPLGTLGDGMRYLLGLAISLVYADGGVLLVDEIDTGLHYSIMGDLWRLVVETAKKRDIQVFATTHSLDCVRGLAWLCDNYPDLKNEVSLQKIDPGINKSIDIDADGIVLAVEEDMEVR